MRANAGILGKLLRSQVNIPNALTISRLVAIPVLMALLLVRFPGHDQVAAALFIAFSLTDTVDGQLARRSGTVSDLGKFLDPLADDEPLAGGVRPHLRRPAPDVRGVVPLPRHRQVGALDLVRAEVARLPGGGPVAHVALEHERLDSLLAQLGVPAGDLLEVVDAGDLEPDEVGGVVRDPLRVGLGEADADRGRGGVAVHDARPYRQRPRAPADSCRTS